MRHFVLTRSSFGPAWDIGSNRRRFAMTRAVTARLLSRQSVEWTWIVRLDERDPLLRDRMALYGDSAPAFRPLVCSPPSMPPRKGALVLRQRVAAADYKAPWRSLIPADDTALMTRLDDDDGLAIDALARYQSAAEGMTTRAALMLPVGVWTFRRLSVLVRHDTNAMHTLVTPPGDTMCVYDYGHTRVARAVQVVTVDLAPGWLWVRHRDTISGRGIPTTRLISRRDVTAQMRAIFPIDRAALERAWH